MKTQLKTPHFLLSHSCLETFVIFLRRGPRRTANVANARQIAMYVTRELTRSTYKVIGSGSLLHTLEGHTDWVNDAVFSPDGRRVAIGSEIGAVAIFDLTPALVRAPAWLADFAETLLAQGEPLALPEARRRARYGRPLRRAPPPRSVVQPPYERGRPARR